MAVKFINLTNHNLTEKQKIEFMRDVEKTDVDFISQKDFIQNDDVLNYLKNMDDNTSKMYEVIEYIIDRLRQYTDNTDNFIYLHLPVGSPAFMFFFQKMLMDSDINNLIIVFSYSERKVIEVEDDNGNIVKKSIFDFKGFQYFSLR